MSLKGRPSCSGASDVANVTSDERRARVIVDAVGHEHSASLRDGDLEFLRQRLARASELLAALDRVPLANSDHPDSTCPLVEQTIAIGRRRP